VSSVTRWDQLGSDRNIRLFAAWVVREARQQIEHADKTGQPQEGEPLWNSP